MLTTLTTVVTYLLSTPLFLIGVAFFVIGGSIGLVKRIIS